MTIHWDYTDHNYYPFDTAFKIFLENQDFESLKELPTSDSKLDFEASTPPEDIYFRCECCFRGFHSRQQNRLVQIDVPAVCFSYTPIPKAAVQTDGSFTEHRLEGRCLLCTRYFKGKILKYDFGRRILWARFCRETTSKVMES